jgi:Fur family transcriptional regulator, iron response regulator
VLTSGINRTKQVLFLFPSVAQDGEGRAGDRGNGQVQTSRTYSGVLERLKEAGLRPTRQRLALAKLLLESGPRHVTAEELFHEARTAGFALSLATVYNTLHQFTSVGLLREVVVDLGQSYFDTNISHHHHFFDESSGTLTDIPDHEVEIGRLPKPPSGSEIDRVEVIVRLRRSEP